MNNYELDKKAKELVDSETPYNLARSLVELESRLNTIVKDSDKKSTSDNCVVQYHPV